MRANVLAFFFVKVAIVYMPLILPPLPAQAYSVAFRAGANLFFRTIGDSGRAYFGPNLAGGDHDTAIVVKNLRPKTAVQGRSGVSGAFEVSSRSIGFSATAFVVALIVATPVPWRRRLLAVLAGVALISVFAGFQMYLHLVDAFSNPDPLRIYQLGPAGKSLLLNLIKICSRTPVTTYIAPIFVWILVTFRHGDIVRLAPMAGTATTTQRTSHA